MGLFWKEVMPRWTLIYEKILEKYLLWVFANAVVRFSSYCGERNAAYHMACIFPLHGQSIHHESSCNNLKKGEEMFVLHFWEKGI